MTEKTVSQGAYNAEQLEGTVDVDLVLCIDSTESMAPIMRLTKKRALQLADDVAEEIRTQGKQLGSLRVKLIAFRDYQSDQEYAMQVTDFFDYPAERADLADLMADVVAAGGGDEAESGLEAVAYAMDSDWTPSRPGAVRRQIIAVWTDAPAHRLGTGKNSSFYDPSLPKSFEELSNLWGRAGAPGRMDNGAKRMVLFAPRVKPWTVLECTWDQVTLYPSAAGRELTEADYCEIIYQLVKKV